MKSGDTRAGVPAALRRPRGGQAPPQDFGPGGFRISVLAFSSLGSGFRVQGSGFRVQGSGFRVQGSGFRVPESSVETSSSSRPSGRCVNLFFISLILKDKLTDLCGD